MADIKDMNETPSVPDSHKPQYPHGYPQVVDNHVDTVAPTALVSVILAGCSLAGILMSPIFGILCSIAGIICGHIALKQTASQKYSNQRRMAIVGTISSYAFFLIYGMWVAMIAVMMLMGGMSGIGD